MSARELAWRACYELLAKRVRRPEWSFMNYGYAPLAPDEVPADLEPEDEPDRLCIQLYAHVAAASPLAGRDVLEVGCGRGGGVGYVHRYLRPRAVTGLDFSRAAITLCRQHRQAPGVRFEPGDAQAMPFAAATFDAVINVESSHCYDSMPAFLAEVSRVLRPGGELLWADLRRSDGVEGLRRQFDASGLTVATEQDITANVLRALELDDARKRALMQAWIPRPVHRVFRPFAGLEGTRNYVGFESGELRYLSARLVKDVERPAPVGAGAPRADPPRG